jgi:hypothetical protein
VLDLVVSKRKNSIKIKAIIIDELEESQAIRTDHKPVSTVIDANYNRINWTAPYNETKDFRTIHIASFKEILIWELNIKRENKNNNQVDEDNDHITNAFNKAIDESCKNKRNIKKRHRFPKKIVQILKEVKAYIHERSELYKHRIQDDEAKKRNNRNRNKN